MTALLTPAPPTAAPTASIIDTEGWDWVEASELEIRIEAGYLRERLKREADADLEEELKRVLTAAKEKGISL